MNNYGDLNLYLVDEGTVSAADAETECDGINSVIVAATSKTAALGIADAYDRGEIAIGNMAWNGGTVAALYSRDAFGNYA